MPRKTITNIRQFRAKKFQKELSSAIDRALAPSRKVHAQVMAFFIRLGFSRRYAKIVADDVAEDFANETMDVPIWLEVQRSIVKNPEHYRLSDFDDS